MRGVFKRLGRSAVLFALLTVVVAPGAAAKSWRDEPGWGERFERAKRVIVTLLGRLTPPPGEPGN